MDNSSTASAISELDRYTGVHVRVLPYVRGCYPRDMLYRLWHVIEQEGASEKLFFSGFPRGTPISCHGDLIHFMQVCSEPGRVTLLIESVADQELAGAFWFEDFIPDWRCLASIFIRRKYWGAISEEAARLSLAYAFEQFNLQAIWALTPWATARSLSQRCGLTEVATLPGFVTDADNEPRDVSIWKVTKGEFNALAH